MKASWMAVRPLGNLELLRRFLPVLRRRLNQISFGAERSYRVGFYLRYLTEPVRGRTRKHCHGRLRVIQDWRLENGSRGH